MTAPVAKDRSDPSPGAPSPDHPVRGPPGLFTEFRRPSTCGTPRITNVFFRSPNPSRFSRISPNSRISAGFSKFSFKAGLNSATKRGLSFGSVAMKAGSMVKLFSAGWQVPQVRPLPPNVSLKNRSLPFAMSWLKRSGGGGALLQPDSPTRAHRTKAVENSSRERIRPPFSSGVSYSFDSTSIHRPRTHAGHVLLAARQGGVTEWTVLGLADARGKSKRNEWTLRAGRARLADQLS